MDVFLNLFTALRWLASPVGGVAIVAIATLILSGVPGRLLLVISARMPR